MLRILTATLLLASSSVLAQDMKHDHGGTNHRAMASTASQTSEGVPTQPGQAAFAAIQEIVQILEADPRTDWSKVDIEGLRQHLIDMNNVTMAAAVDVALIESGLRFTVTGAGIVRDSIRRMVNAHAATMNGIGGWKFAAASIDEGATLSVVVPAADIVKVRALGFIGVMTHGMHHQEHHLMLARGQHPH